jgi:hypothetical protein
MSDSQFTVGTYNYRADRLDAFKQLAVARRLGPFVTAFFDTIAIATGPTPFSAYEPILKAIGQMSDDDANFILNTCLSVVSRQSGAGWQKVLAAPGTLQFADLSPSDMLVLTGKVLEAHKIAGFFSELLSLSMREGENAPNS